MICYITHVMLYNKWYDMSDISHDMFRYITHDMLCYITHVMLCYITHDMLYNT